MADFQFQVPNLLPGVAKWLVFKGEEGNTGQYNLTVDQLNDPVSYASGGVVTPGASLVNSTFSIFDKILAADAASSARWIADRPCQLIAVREAHSVVGGAAAALQVEKLTGTTAPGSGTLLLQATIDLTATINTVVSGVLTATVADLQFAVGNRLGLRLTGTLTGLVGTVDLLFKQIT